MAHVKIKNQHITQFVFMSWAPFDIILDSQILHLPYWILTSAENFRVGNPKFQSG